MRRLNRTLNRREFLQTTTLGAGAVILGAAGIPAFEAASRAAENPFAYDVERFGKTDPKLIGYEEAGRFASLTSEPKRITVGAEGHFYIAGKNGVSVLDRGGSRVTEFALASPARCLAVSADGTVHVGLRDHVEVFDRQGRSLANWEALAKKAWLTGLAVSDNSLFAADSGNRLVWHYDKSGKVIGRIGEKNKERQIPGFVVPSPYLDVELARDGLLRVNNPGRHRVEAYTVDGDLELFWGKPSAGIEGFCGCCNPIGLALLPDGRCVTSEKGLPRVKVYGADGKFESVVAGPESFPQNARACSGRGLSDCTTGGLDVAVDAAGQVCVLDLITAEVRIFRRKASA